ncbi:MAG: Ig-like domain-containing protein, partial [Planctomycetaceae bacterium]
IADAAGQPVAGTIEIDNDETRWRFRPASAWSPGSYYLLVDAALEDLAGNSIAHPFEVDLQATVEREAVAKTVTRSFEILPLGKEP